jgi:hypothetical protein
MELHKACTAPPPAQIPTGAAFTDLVPKEVKLWALQEGNALVAEGTAKDLSDLRELIGMLDQPVKRVETKVEAIAVPASGFKVWSSGSKHTTISGLVGLSLFVGDPEPLIAKMGGKRVGGQSRLSVVTGNNRLSTIWLGSEVAHLYGPNGLGVGLTLRPRVNADDSILLFLMAMEALPDDVQGARTQGHLYTEVRVASGDGLLIPLRPSTEPRVQGEELLVLLTPRILPPAD